MSRMVAVVVAMLPLLTWAAAPLHHELSVSLDPAKRSLQAIDRITIAAGAEVALRLGARFRIEHLALDRREFRANRTGAGEANAWRIDVRAPADRAALLEVRYAGDLDALDTALDHRQVLGLSQPFAGGEGAFLPANSGWYPAGDRVLITYRMRVTVPAGVRPVASGRVVAETATTNGCEAIFEATDPLTGIDLMAGPYVVGERIVSLQSGREARVRTYFHDELEGLAASYLESAAAYLQRYDASIGPYAFATYSVVSSPLPTGFGMPGIAYLGKQVLRLPFIRTTSLGHEVLHDWWGNGVYPDYARGNWSEGLTTFLADYAFKEEEGAAQARAMRLAWLRDFAAVPPEHDRPLSAFVSRRHGADQAVGYNKTAFVFFMLRDLIGSERFHAGLRRFWTSHRFRYADWEDLRKAFEASADRDLRAFFAQWITRSGAPAVEIASARRSTIAGENGLLIELHQSGTAYQLNVPVRVQLENGARHDALASLSGARTLLRLELPARAHSVTLDPDTRIFRRLERDEIAPILREVTLDTRSALVVAGEDALVRTTANALASALLEHAPRAWEGAPIEHAPHLLIIGLHSDVARFLSRQRLPELPQSLTKQGTAVAYARRNAGGNAYVVVSARDVQSLGALARALPHLGSQSFVVFDGARPVERGVWPLEPRRYVVKD